MQETDEKGVWEVTQAQYCKVRVLVKPSQAFLDWQASNPVPEPKTTIDVPGSLRSLEARIAALEGK